MKSPRKARRPAAEKPASLFPDVAPDRATTNNDALMVLTSDEELVHWNRRRIVEVLIREAGVDKSTADAISRRVELQLQSAQLSAVTTSLIRELVGAELVSLGLAVERSRHARLGVSMFDVGQIMRGRGAKRRGSKIQALDPATTADTLARRIKRDYALGGVFSERIADAHRKGDLHIHALDAIDRPQSLWLTLEGLQRTGRIAHSERLDPAPAAEALFEQIARLVSTLSGYASREIGIEALNVSLAPYLAERDDDELVRAAAHLVHELDRSTVAVHGSARLAATLQWDLPDPLAGSPAIGPRGATVGTCSDHAEPSRRIALALLWAIRRTSARLRPPALTLVLGPRFFRTRGHLEVLELAAETASILGVPTFRFERPRDVAPSPPGRRTKALRRVRSSDLCRAATLATVAVDLPRLAYLDNDEESIEARLLRVLDLVAQAHIDKRVFLEELLAHGAAGPLNFLTEDDGAGPILSIDDAEHAIQLCGLNELAEVATGAPLHRTPESMAFGRRFLELTARQVETLSRRHKLHFRLVAEPDPVSAARFAKLDLRYHSPLAGHHVKGNLGRGDVYYSPGVTLASDARLSILNRAEAEGALHRAAGGTSATRVKANRLGRSKSVMAKTIMEIYQKTTCRELIVDP